MAETASTADRIRRLEDLDEIRALQQAYRRTLDNRDFAGYAALFTEDAEWSGSYGTERGPAAILAMLERTQHDPVGDNYHFLANQVIDVDGDRATAECTFAVISRAEDNTPYLRVLGTYNDELVRTDAGWRFQRRATSGEMRPR